MQVKKKKKEHFTVMRSGIRRNFDFGHFALLFYRRRQRNAPKRKTHVRSDCFACSLTLLFCGVLVAIAVVVN